MEYISGPFTKLAETIEGKFAWKLISSSAMRERMEFLSTLRVCALDAVAIELQQKFPMKIKEVRFRKMIGHMVSLVMKSYGYILDGRVQSRSQTEFDNGRRYKKGK